MIDHDECIVYIKNELDRISSRLDGISENLSKLLTTLKSINDNESRESISQD
jgi:hypothetical protein